MFTYFEDDAIPPNMLDFTALVQSPFVTKHSANMDVT